MFDCTLTMLLQLINFMPGLIGIYIVFDLTGSLLFGKR